MLRSCQTPPRPPLWFRHSLLARDCAASASKYRRRLLRETAAQQNNMNQKIILKGLGASSGRAQGAARIVRNSSDTDKFQNGEILVAKMTNPTMVIMMAKASAIVTDTGGVTCHAAIVSREMGIPCVVAVKNSTQTLKDGQEIIVDGDKGEIYAV